MRTDQPSSDSKLKELVSDEYETRRRRSHGSMRSPLSGDRTRTPAADALTETRNVSYTVYAIASHIVPKTAVMRSSVLGSRQKATKPRTRKPVAMLKNVAIVAR